MILSSSSFAQSKMTEVPKKQNDSMKLQSSSMEKTPLTHSVIVYFENPLSKPKKNELKAFSKKIGLKLTYIGKKLPYAQLSRLKPFNLKTGNKLCKTIRTFPKVIDCFNDLQQELNEQTEGNTSVEVNHRVKVNKCQLFKDNKDVSKWGSSDFWAQEAVGADLLDEERKKQPFLANVPTYACDASIYNHGEKVGAIARNNNPKSKSFPVRECLYTSNLLKSVDKIAEKNPNRISLINYSLGSRDYNWDKVMFPPNKSLPNIVIVKAAGNSWASKPTLSANTNANAHDNFFVVGAINENGLPALYSSEGPGVLISAPSGSGVISCPTNRKRCEILHKTSAATPLVSHGLEAALQVLPYISKPQLRDMIKKTAIPMVFSYEKNQKNGVGMFNSYKLWKVAQRIAKLCTKSNKFKKKCLSKALSDPKTYSFSHSIDNNFLNKNFPNCFSSTKKRRCKLEKVALKKLRQAAFLQPSNNKLWKILACINRMEGFEDNEKFYQNIGRNFNNNPFSYEELGIKNINLKALRAAPYVKNGNDKLMTLKIGSGYDIETAMNNFFRINKDPSSIFTKALLSADVNDRRTAAANLHLLKSNLTDNLAYKALRDVDEEVGYKAIGSLMHLDESHQKKYIREAFRFLKGEGLRYTISMSYILGKEAFQKIEKFVNHTNPGLRAAAIKSLSLIDKKKSLQIVINGLKDDDPAVRRASIGALEPSPASMPHYLSAMDDKDRSVKESVINSVNIASRFGGRAQKALPIFNKGLNDSDPRIRYKVLLQFSNYKTEGVKKGFLKAIEDKDPSVRRYAEGVLKQWGK